MYILAFETTGPVGSAALADGEGRLLLRCTTEPMSHLKRLAEMAGELMEEAGIGPAEIGAVAASVGPGSFTGIRIGVTTARTFAQARGIPCVPVSALEIFAQHCGKGHPVAAVFNARRGQVYGAVYGADGTEVLAPGPYMLTDVLEAVRDLPDAVFYGDGVDAYAEQLAGYACAPKEERYQTAAMTAKAALAKIEAGGTVSYEDLMPDYMRATEAEQKLADGTLEKLRAAKLKRFMENNR